MEAPADRSTKGPGAEEKAGGGRLLLGYMANQ